MIYAELWFDEERDRDWKVTLWQIEEYDFDPMTAPYITLDLNTQNQHKARKVQLDIVKDLKQETTVVANAYMERSRYEIRPRWFENLLSPLGKLDDAKNSTESEINFSDLRQTYRIWHQNQEINITAG